jgi:tetratricopeptide (TPR) repeat protein
MAPQEARTLANRYLILAKIGSGGMGTVYRARDARKGRAVAIKVLHGHLAEDPAYLERFRREAKIALALDSRHIVQVLDFGHEGESHYLVMEHVEGSSLRMLLRQRGSLPLEDALSIAIQVARGLEEAHSKGVVHRDIKPENIMVLDDGTAKVADFGIARVQELSSLTITGSLVGTVQYMAPEALTGGADPRSDIYSLGIVLYQMLTGSPPFDAPTPWEVMRQHREEPPPPVRERAPDLPEAIEDLLDRCLAKDPEERFQSALELRRELERLLQNVVSEGAPEEAAATPAGGPAGEKLRLRPARLLCPVAAPLAAALAGAVGGLAAAAGRVWTFLAQASGSGRVPPALRYILGGGAVLAVGLGCYGIYEAATSGGGGLFPPIATSTPGPAPTPAPPVQIRGKESEGSDGVILVPTFEVGPALRVKSVVRLPFRVRYEGEAPGCSGGWGSDNTAQQEAVDRGEPGMHLEGPAGEVSELVYASGVGAENATLDCDTWYEGAWVFAPVGDWGTAVVQYPNFESTQIALPGESSPSPNMPTYTVRDEDTLASITEYFGVSESDLSSANPGLTETAVTTGRTLKIPVSQEEAVSRELSYGALDLQGAEFSARAAEAAFIALGLDPNNGEAHFAMGIALYRAQQLDASLASLRRAVELRPGVAIYHSWLAAVLLETGDTQAARSEAEEALRLEPNEGTALGILGSLASATPPPPTATQWSTVTPTSVPTVTQLPPQTETPTPTLTPEPSQAFLGVGLENEPEGGGAVITQVLCCGAEFAGLRVGDVIQTVDGKAVSDAQGVKDAIDAKQPGDELVLRVLVATVWDVTITLGELDGRAFLGVALKDKPGGGGAVITEVVAQSPAEAAGMLVGGVIKAVDGKAVSDAQGVKDAIAAKEPGDTVVFAAQQVFNIAVTLGTRPEDQTGQPSAQ